MTRGKGDWGEKGEKGGNDNGGREDPTTRSPRGLAMTL
jgi:hypothetical protein